MVTHEISTTLHTTELSANLNELNLALDKKNSSNSNNLKDTFYNSNLVNSDLTKEELIAPIISHYENIMNLRKSEIFYHRQMEVIAKTELPKIKDHKEKKFIASSIVNKRLALHKQITALYEVFRI